MDSEENKSLGESLIKTLGESDLPDIAQDLAEIALDSLLFDGVFKDIPVISTIVRLGKTAFAIRDYFLIKKVLAFLQGMKDIPAEERKSFAGRLEAEKDFQKNVGETTIMLLDKYDHLDKARLMAKLFGAYVKGEIDYDKFLRLSTSMDRAFIKDLNDLLDYFLGKTTGHDSVVKRAKQNLYSSNLSSFYVLTEEEYKRSGAEHPQVYHFNEYGQEFARIILGSKFVSDRW